MFVIQFIKEIIDFKTDTIQFISFFISWQFFLLAAYQHISIFNNKADKHVHISILFKCFNRKTKIYDYICSATTWQFSCCYFIYFFVIIKLSWCCRIFIFANAGFKQSKNKTTKVQSTTKACSLIYAASKAAAKQPQEYWNLYT